MTTVRSERIMTCASIDCACSSFKGRSPPSVGERQSPLEHRASADWKPSEFSRSESDCAAAMQADRVGSADPRLALPLHNFADDPRLLAEPLQSLHQAACCIRPTNDRVTDAHVEDAEHLFTLDLTVPLQE